MSLNDHPVVDASDRPDRAGQPPRTSDGALGVSAGFTVWFTGLSGSGKSTIAGHLAATLRARGLPVVIIDGDEVRAGLSADLGFSRADRDTQVRRVGWMCDLLTRSGVVAIAALVSPYEATRAEVRAAIGRCLLVAVEAPLSTLHERDPKGLYREAAAGRVTDLTGVGDPYEPALDPDVRCVTDGSEPPEACAGRVLERLIELGLLPREVADEGRLETGPGYLADEEDDVRERLAQLGYID